jgi:hypothetical protein
VVCLGSRAGRGVHGWDGEGGVEVVCCVYAAPVGVRYFFCEMIFYSFVREQVRVTDFFWKGVPWSGPVEPVGYRLSCPSVKYDMDEGGDRSSYTCVQQLSDVFFYLMYFLLTRVCGFLWFLGPFPAVLQWTAV